MEKTGDFDSKRKEKAVEKLVDAMRKTVRKQWIGEMHNAFTELPAGLIDRPINRG